MPRPAKPVPDKSCEWCGIPLQRKRFNGRLEGYGEYQRRKFCDLSCANSRTQITRGGYLWRARKLRGPKCEACGVTRRLHAHHVNGDITETTPENIQTLCGNCHNFWHAALERRGLPISGRMPALF